MIPAAFDYLRAHTTDEAFAHLQQHGAEARVLAGGQSLIPAMRFRLARPAVLVDINEIGELNYLRMSDGVLAIGAIARDTDIERAPWIGDRRWSVLHDVSRVATRGLGPCRRGAATQCDTKHLEVTRHSTQRRMRSTSSTAAASL